MNGRSIYDSPRMAAGYAFSRPPVHARIIGAIAHRLPRAVQEPVWALDIGCGAGLSTAALEPVASRRVGIEPVRAMLTHCRTVAPASAFVNARAENLPFAAASFDLIAAAGSLNYVRLERFLPEAARVLRRGGALVVYDFSAARRIRDDRRLDDWFTSFAQRYPFPGGYDDMDIRRVNLEAAGLALSSYETLEVGLPMTFTQYVDYVLSETNVQAAIDRGEREGAIRQWCEPALRAIFGDDPQEIVFSAYAAVVTRR